MNILYVSSKKNWGGVISLTVRTARELEKRGHRVWIVSARHSVLTRKAPKGIHLVPRKFGMDFNPATIYFLVRLIRKQQIDLVVTNIKKELSTGGVAARICGIPSVRLIGNERDFKNIRELHLRVIDQCILPCEYTRKTALEQVPWLPEHTLHVIYNGLDPAEFGRDEKAAVKRSWGLGPDDPVIGLTGRLVTSKGIDFLIRAFAGIAGRYPDWTLVITGRGKDGEIFKELARGLNMEKRILFPGFTSEPLASAAAYDIGILASDFEAFPYVVVEYMAAGVPVIATRTGGTEELVTHEKNGFIIEPRNEPELCRYLSLLMEDGKLRRSMGKAAAQSIGMKFSEQRMNDRFEEKYRAWAGR
ncbi:glycosyltransferase family 4 protein [bacterium]|nr:glycosyltransferase family 4 protein [bacterium]